MAIKKEITDHRPAADPVGLCWRTFLRNQRGVLRIELGSGKTFLLPYMHWSHAHLEKTNEIEELTIHFSSHDVRIEGRDLRELLLELQASNVELLREISEQAQKVTNGPVICAITVTETAATQ